MPTSVKRVLLFIALYLLFYEHVQVSKNVTNGFAREPVAGADGLKIGPGGWTNFMASP